MDHWRIEFEGYGPHDNAIAADADVIARLTYQKLVHAGHQLIEAKFWLEGEDGWRSLMPAKPEAIPAQASESAEPHTEAPGPVEETPTVTGKPEMPPGRARRRRRSGSGAGA